MSELRAVILGKTLCQSYQEAAMDYAARGYAVEFKDIDHDVDVYALHQLLDGGETIPVIILRGVPESGR